MKKVLVMLVAVFMVFSLVACGGEEVQEEKEQYTNDNQDVIIAELETQLDENQVAIADLETQISTLQMNIGMINNNQDVVVHNFEVEIARLEALIVELQPETE